MELRSPTPVCDTPQHTHTHQLVSPSPFTGVILVLGNLASLKIMSHLMWGKILNMVLELVLGAQLRVTSKSPFIKLYGGMGGRGSEGHLEQLTK